MGDRIDRGSRRGSWVQGGRGRHAHRGPASAQPGAGGPAASDPRLVDTLKQALRADGPLILLATASSIWSAFDERLDDPFAPHDPHHPFSSANLDRTRADFIASLIGVDASTTTALLTLIAEFTTDDALEDRLRTELQRRRHRLPRWLATLLPLRIEGRWSLSDQFGDVHNTVIGVRTDGGHPLTVVVMTDHLTGDGVDEVIVQDRDADTLLADAVREAPPGLVLEELDAAEVRARLEQSIELHAMTWPQWETEEWPAARPLLEWILRRLPEGGTGWGFREWDEDEQQAIVAEFMASPQAAGVGTFEAADVADIADWLTWYGTGYGNRDPYRWSPDAVADLLLDWLPRKVMASVDDLVRVPEVLRAFVEWGHDRVGLSPDATRTTSEAVAELEPDYLLVIRARDGLSESRWGGGLAEVSSRGDWVRDLARDMLPLLADEVGGAAALEALDDEPLPDEDLALDDVAEDIRSRVMHIGELADAACDALLDVEYRTAARRLLVDVAKAEPGLFRRRSNDDRLAAAVVYAVHRCNEGWGTPSEVTVADITAWFGVGRNLSARGRTVLAAVGIETADLRDPVLAGTPRYLTSTRRRWLVRQYDLATSD